MVAVIKHNGRAFVVLPDGYRYANISRSNGSAMSASAQLLATLAVVTVGAMIGRLQFRGVRLDVAAMLLLGVGVAHFGIVLSPELGLFGLLLFLYTVGVRSGPALRGLNRSDMKMSVTGLGIMLIALACMVLLGRLVEVPLSVSLGAYAGFFGSGGALALLERGEGAGGASAAFAVAAPIGAVFILMLVQIWHAISRNKIGDELSAWNVMMERQQEHLETSEIVVDRDEVIGKPLRDLHLDCQVLWVYRNDSSECASADTVLGRGDVICVCGAREAIESTGSRVGNAAPAGYVRNQGRVVVKKFFVSNPDAIERRIEDLMLRERFGATVTRIRRAGIVLGAHPGFRFRWGDRIQVSAPVDKTEGLRLLFGDDNHGLEEFAFPRAALVIFVGGMLGAAPLLSLGEGEFLRLGPALGVLVVSLATTALHRTGRMVWSQSGPTTKLMSQIGLPLFLSQVGNESYDGLMRSWAMFGVQLVLLSFAPVVIITALVALAGKLFKLGPLTLLSLLPSVALNTPALNNLQDSYKEKIPGHVYATVYPIVSVGLIASLFALSLLM